MSEALRDGNRVTTALFESSSTAGLTLNGQIDQSTGRILVQAVGLGSGDVVGPASSTANALARYSGTTGKIIKNSTATMTDAGALSLVGGTTGVPGLTVATVAGQNAEVWVTQPTGSTLKVKAQNTQVRFTTNSLPILFDSDDSGTLMASISAAGVGAVLVPPTLADAAANNNSVYFSSDASKLVYKDSGGVVHALY